MKVNYGSLPSSSANVHDGERDGLVSSSHAADRFAFMKSAGKGVATALVVIGLAIIGLASYEGGPSMLKTPILGRPKRNRRGRNGHHHNHNPPPAPQATQPQQLPAQVVPAKVAPAQGQGTLPCDSDPKSANSCDAFFTSHTALSVKPSTCPAGTKKEVKPPSWFAKCKSQTGACPAGCGTCKPPDQQAGGGCFCAGSSAMCTAECGYPGSDDDKTCKTSACLEDDPEEAGCIPLGDNCGGYAQSKCMDAQGTVTKGSCGYSSAPLNPGQQCLAFCSQIPGTKKCETTRMQSYVWPGSKNPCPKNALTAVTSDGQTNVCSNIPGIVLLNGDFSRCAGVDRARCPYDSGSRHCSYADGSQVQIDQNLKDEGVTVPNQACPTLKNVGSQGFPSFFTNPRVPSGADNACQTACACNTRRGFGPPDCFQPGEPFPGPQNCCYCDGKNIAYDKNKFDDCGHWLPIFGEGVLPSQYECYSSYAKKNGLDNAFPEPKDYMCVPI